MHGKRPCSEINSGQYKFLHDSSLFLDRTCHGGGEFTKATVSHIKKERLERMIMGDGNEAVYDNGFYNIGVTPTANDPGLGGKDPFGNPLSFTRQYVSGNKVDPFEVDESTFAVPCAESPCDLNGARVAVDGAFAQWDDVPRDGAEIAFIPPVSGG